VVKSKAEKEARVIAEVEAKAKSAEEALIAEVRVAAEKAAVEAFMAARNEASAKSKLRAVPEAKAEAQMKWELLQKRLQEKHLWLHETKQAPSLRRKRSWEQYRKQRQRHRW
jgi:hypothetical protein